jgi:uncharacterized membrane protein HdeD (DUF308 family)
MTIALQPSAATPLRRSPPNWLPRYYGARALFSVVWVALAVTAGHARPWAGAALLVAYPLWDCLAGIADAASSGGARANPTQALNAAISAAATLAVAIALGRTLHGAVGVIGVWAVLSGLLQLATGLRRWRSATGQWPQLLSGAQSCLGGAVFVARALGPAPVGVTDIAPYAAFGALYFAISACVAALRK